MLLTGCFGPIPRNLGFQYLASCNYPHQETRKDIYKHEKWESIAFYPTMQQRSNRNISNKHTAICDTPLQFIWFLRLGCTPANASSSPPPAGAGADPCSPPLGLDLDFRSFSFCICWVVRWRSSFNFLFFSVILDWRYSDFPPPPALFHIISILIQSEPIGKRNQGGRVWTHVNSTLILLGGYFPSSNVEWWYNFRHVFMRSKFSNSMNAKPRHLVGLSFSVATRTEAGGFLVKWFLMDSLLAE